MMQKILGQVLLWAGFLSGAVAAVIRTDNAEAPWQTINWYWFVASIVAGIVGVIVLRSRRAATLSRTRAQGNLDRARAHLARLVERVRVLRQNHPEMTPRQTLDYINSELADDLREFADARNSVATEYGLEAFAEVMSGFATGERYLNRAWSASADGYVDEASVCIDRGLAQLEIAQKALEDRIKAAAPGGGSVSPV